MNDPIEAAFEALMKRHSIGYVRPERLGGRIDFFLPAFGLFVEVKAHACDRMVEQLDSVSGKPVMLLIGLQSVRALEDLLNA